MTKITIFPSVRETSSGHIITIEQAINRIRNNPNQHDLIQRIRNTEDKSVRDELKKTLPAYCFSGVFSRKNAASIQEHSGLICLDFDGETKENIMRKSEYIFACFLSPSGKGYKVLVRIPPSIEDHENYFLSLKEHFDLPSFDIKVKNISTACFDTEDPDVYYNPDAPIYLQMHYAESHKGFAEIPPALVMNNSDRIIEKLQKWIDRTDSFRAGRNNYIHKFACALNRYGINHQEAIGYLLRYVEPDFTSSEIQRTVKSAYTLNAKEFKTEFFKDNEPIYAVQNWLRANINPDQIKDKLEEEYQISGNQADAIIDQAMNPPNTDIFWWVKTTKNGDSYHVDKTALRKIYEKYAINRYEINENTWIMVKINGGIVHELNQDGIRNIIREHFKNIQADVINGHPKHLIQNQIEDRLDENYIKDEKLAWLPPTEINFQKDDRDTAYFYYENCFVKVTADSIDCLEYSTTMSQFIWKDQVIKRKFTPLANYSNLSDQDLVYIESCWDESEFCKFIWLVSTANEPTKENIENFDMICNTIGYILHGYKDKSNPKAVIITDEIISDVAQGGVGKGIFIQGISHMKRTEKFDGKLWSWGKSFLYQRVTLATQVLVWEDVLKNFNFEKLFSLITDGIEVEKKNKDSFYIPYQDAPKVIITSNYVLNGQGDSQERRRHEIQFKRYFHKNYKPIEYFGHNLFDGWDDRQWQLFDNFMIFTVHRYLRNGLQQPVNINLKFKKLLQNVPEEVFIWYKDHIKPVTIYKLNEVVRDVKLCFEEHSKADNRVVMNWFKHSAEFLGQDLVKVTRRDGVYFEVSVKMM